MTIPFKSIVASFLVFLLPSCTVYTEKQSEALSKSVYATKDSIEHGRIDLADHYIEQTARIVKPPKKRIVVAPILENLELTKTENVKEPNTSLNTNTSSPTLSQEKRRVLIVPERFKNDPVVVVNTKEYEKILQDQETYKQLQKDHETLLKTKNEVDQELNKQEKYYNQMVVDLNKMQKQLVEKDLAILKRNVIIVVLIAVGATGVYLRMKGIL